jgi:hypothetical protein
VTLTDPPPPRELVTVVGYGDGTDLVVRTVVGLVFAMVRYLPEGVAYSPLAFPTGAWTWLTA